MSDNYLFVFCADTHCGSTLGLIKPEPFNLFDGGTYTPTPSQMIIWKVWEEAWNKVREERKGKRLIIVHDGDAVEGFHHMTAEIVSIRDSEHEQIHVDCMEWAMKTAKFDASKGDAIYYVSGTEEHVGSGSKSEERIAKDLDGVVPMNDHRYTWNAIRKSINGVYFDVSHHGGTGGNNLLNDENPLRSRVKNIYLDCIDQRIEIPRYWIRAHIHRYINAEYHGTQGTIQGIILPSFQFKTGYVYKRMNNRVQPQDIGLVWVNVDKDGKTDFGGYIKREVQDKVGSW
jgi:hypothetical protein